MIALKRARVAQPVPSGPHRLTDPLSVAVIGGGIAGIAAATVLAERGAAVTLFEKEQFLGGRAGAWTDTLSDGTSFEMERGFHAFFRQYYNLRALLERVDPSLSMLSPVSDYPICGPGRTESFANLSKRVPLNLAQLVLRTDTLSFGDLLRVNARAAMAMLAFDQETVYERFDTMSAGAYLDSLRFPPAARRMLFDVFAHSFFNPESEMSAAELLMMFHFYFTGNPEGLLFDVAREPFSTAFWRPMEERLRGQGVAIRLGSAPASVDAIERGYRVLGDRFDAVILAVDVKSLQSIVGESPSLDSVEFRGEVDSLALTRRFAVWRLWLDARPSPGRAPFAGTTGVGILDNISIYELFEGESAAWSERSGGSVVELHGYAVAPEMSEAEIKAELWSGLEALYPETRGAPILDQRFLLRRDCPAFAPGSWARRPKVATAHIDLVLAGDFVKLPMPSALMERAAASGFMAANQILARRSVASEPIWSVPQRGVAARRWLRAPAEARA